MPAVETKLASTANDKLNNDKKLGRRELNKRDKLQRLVSAARTLFLINGYEDTTTQQIAIAANIGAGTLFLYAKTKGDLLLLVFKDELNEVIDKAWETIPENVTLVPQILALFDGNIQYHKRDIPTARALMRELVFSDNPEHRPGILAAERSVIAKLALLISRAQDKGEVIENTDPLIAAQCVFSIYHEQLQNWLSDYLDYKTFRNNLQRRIEFVLQGIASPTDNE